MDSSPASRSLHRRKTATARWRSQSYVQTAKAFKLRDLFADARPASVISNPFNCGQPVFPCAKSGLAILDARPLPVLTGSARARVLRQPSIGVNEARGHTSCHGAQTLCLAPAPPAAPPRRERLDVRIGRRLWRSRERVKAPQPLHFR